MRIVTEIVQDFFKLKSNGGPVVATWTLDPNLKGSSTIGCSQVATYCRQRGVVWTASERRLVRPKMLQ